MVPHSLIGNKPELLALVGPTASGKSALALKLAQALNGEVVSADSVQIYKYFDIGSGKPEPEELAAVPHHLISTLEPTEEVDASVYAELAKTQIEDILRRGKRPIVCGGSFLWVKALVFGLVPAPPKDDAVREKHRQWALTEGRPALHLKLQEVDPTSAERLNPNDLVRVSRALEVFELTGKRLSELQAEHGFSEPKYDVRLIGIRHDPEALTERIRQRVLAMLGHGWLEEVTRLAAQGYRSTRAMSSVGYRQVLMALDACAQEGAPLDRAQLVEDVTRVTKIFARRQRTWLRDLDMTWLTPEQAEWSSDSLMPLLGLETKA